jgi:uncharacterized DUF497 family protein
MPLEYDPLKNQRNLELRGLSFELANDFQWRTALVGRDDRQNYGEDRYWALGYIGQDLYNVVFTMRENTIRVISLRKASKKERSAHDEKTRSELGR